MRKRLKLIFLGYLALVVGSFSYASFTGTRLLGDDAEEFEPNGPGSQSSGRVRVHRYYHK
ncbi:hypothetical protein [Rufibacter sp. LB8]|uniref:hypothetical protein n=1 Tax=Rufibacter sp. LB8 TaxID=2777781 RepID=UPI00178C3A70|nr:hypothetical protein [Rufibacter sp. LB8]